MRRRSFVWSTCLALGIAGWCRTAAADMTPEIVRRLTAAIERHHLLGQFPTRCVTVLPDEETPDHLDVGVYETHGRTCPGDPGTNPRVLSLRYDKRGQQVLRQNVLEDRYESLR